MKRLLAGWLLIGIVDCGDSTPTQRVSTALAQADDVDPIAALEKLGARFLWTQGEVV
jgi:hypothetical protein